MHGVKHLLEDLRMMHGLARLRLVRGQQRVKRIDLLQRVDFRHALCDSCSPEQPVFGRLSRKYRLKSKLLLEPGELFRACAVGYKLTARQAGGAFEDGRATSVRAAGKGGGQGV